MGERVSADPERIRAIAQLAAIEVTDAELPALTRDVTAILAFVEQLNQLEVGEAALGNDLPGAALRADVVERSELSPGPAEFAPDFRDGFFVVPKLGAMES